MGRYKNTIFMEKMRFKYKRRTSFPRRKRKCGSVFETDVRQYNANIISQAKPHCQTLNDLFCIILMIFQKVFDKHLHSLHKQGLQHTFTQKSLEL